MEQKENKLRLARDIKDIMTNPLEDEGIFYQHDEDELKIGRALIIGPKDTPYEHGFFLFKFIFPEDYPYNPPKVLFDTGNNIVRFHPNLYKTRKVCLSILNTWNGPKWSSCQTIRSILLTLVSILTDKPLLHEPNIDEKYHDFNNYTECITYENLKIANYDYFNYFLNNKYITQYNIFKEVVMNYMKKNIKTIIKKIDKINKNEKGVKFIVISLYGFSSNINYLELKKKYLELEKIFNKN